MPSRSETAALDRSVGRPLAFSVHTCARYIDDTEDKTMPTATGHSSAIRAGKAIGTEVYDRSGNKIGEVKDIILEKTSNNILFAAVSFGGVLGMGQKYHPVPWSELDYDPDKGGYVVSFSADQLKSAPADSLEALTRDDGRAYRDRAYQHYGTKPYWH
jgi:sporulation protein YlmC with PRC-barrel domain